MWCLRAPFPAHSQLPSPCGLLWHLSAQVLWWELCSTSCGSLDRRGVWGSMDTCIRLAGWLCCAPESITTFFSLNLVLAALSLAAACGLLSSCGQQRLLSSCGVRASRGGFSCCRAQTLGRADFSSRGFHGLSCPVVCGIFLDQGLNLRTQHWQAEF